MFRRRRSADVGRNWPREPEDGQGLADDELDNEAYDEPAGHGGFGGEGFPPGPEGFPPGIREGQGAGFSPERTVVPSGLKGPWDAGEPFPPRPRADLGSLQVPMGPEHEIQLVMADQHGAWVTVRHGDSEMQVQAFAAARRGALWEDVRAEIAKEVHDAGGHSEEAEGPFGAELMAHVPAEPGQPASGLRLVRFIGVDGPRWFLRGLFTGPAAGGGEPASLLEEIFRDVVVVRGEHPVPPRDILELRLPPEAQKAFEEQAAAAGDDRFRTDLNPFERGPEFTETR